MKSINETHLGKCEACGKDVPLNHNRLTFAKECCRATWDIVHFKALGFVALTKNADDHELLWAADIEHHEAPVRFDYGRPVTGWWTLPWAALVVSVGDTWQRRLWALKLLKDPDTLEAFGALCRVHFAAGTDVDPTSEGKALIATLLGWATPPVD